MSSGEIYIKIHIFSAPPAFSLAFPSLLFHHFIHSSSNYRVVMYKASIMISKGAQLFHITGKDTVFKSS